MTMCDLCIPGTGDHDRPYEFGRLEQIGLRLTKQEIKRLSLLRECVIDVRNGYPYGPPAGDIAPDGGEWKYAQ